MPHNGPYDNTVAAYAEVILGYADHQSWRCGHPDRYSQSEDCPCGLLGALAAAGIDPEPWRALDEKAAPGSKTDPDPAP